MNPWGGVCCAACADVSCMCLPLKIEDVSVRTNLSGRMCLLHRCFLLQPIFKVLLRHNLEVGLHVVMAQPAELRADNLVPADLGRREMNRDIQSWNKILVHAQRW